jgi:hypothetical protein
MTPPQFEKNAESALFELAGEAVSMNRHGRNTKLRL